MPENKTFIDFHEALMQLSHSAGFIDDRREIKLTALGRLVSRLLGAARVGIWQFDHHEDRLVSESLFDRDTASTDFNSQLKASTIVLSQSDHPAYFAALKEAKLIEASDAQADERTRSFLDSYMIPLGIESMLDAPVFDSGELSGVICVESRTRRDWSLSEISFVAAVADTVSLINTHEAWIRSKQKLDYITHYDTLTGLANLQSLRNRMDHLIKKAERRSFGTFAIIWVDLDRLKTINDGMGAQTGDKVIAEIGYRLRDLYVSGKDRLARIGGDEFAVIIRNHTTPSLLYAATQAVLGEISHPIRTGEHTLNVSASLGICQYPEDGTDSETLLRSAEAAMYHAKTHGRGHARTFDSSIQNNARSRFALESQLRTAIHENKLDVFYQPILDTVSKKIVGAEALVRWHHPDRGWLSPIEFLDIARNAGLIYGLGECVLRRVCEHHRHARNHQIDLPSISINLASEQVLDPNLPSLVRTLCEQHGVAQRDLHFEVTEDAIHGDSCAVQTTLERLVQGGSELSIDDFGTGFSSLSRLKHLPFTTLKIDRSFISDIPADEDDCAITRSIIGLAKGLGLSTVAEGVETLAHERWLEQQGCNFLQGYRYSKPVPFETLTKVLVSPTW